MKRNKCEKRNKCNNKCNNKQIQQQNKIAASTTIATSSLATTERNQ